VHILHFQTGFDAAAIRTVAAACAGRGWSQTIVRAFEGPAPESVEHAEASAESIDLELHGGGGPGGCPPVQVMVQLERIVTERRPDVVLLYGDLDITLAAAVAVAKAGVPTARVEAGVRSGDRSLPNENNRILIERLSSLLFTPSEKADDCLSSEAVSPDRVRRVGPLSPDAAERVADHLEAEARPAGAPLPRSPEDLKAPPVERIIEAQL
jgi:UDP-N-acetylglucosamine 2-epimerase (non-hydrolysing)